MSRVLFLMTASLSLLAVASSHGQADPKPGFSYAPVTPEDVLAMKMFQYHLKRGGGSKPVDFEWTFTKERFTLKEGKGPIPVDLVEKLLPEGGKAKVIEGKWQLAAGRLVMTEIRGDGQPGRENAAVNIYRTAPSVIRVGEPQYVFEVVR